MRRLLAVFAAAALVLSPAVARAHGGLKKAVPAKGAALDTLPREIRLGFSEAAEIAFTRIELIGPNGAVEVKGVLHATGDRRTVYSDVVGALVPGNYTVRWQVAGADGHPVRGSYAFSINPGAAGLATAAPQPAVAAQVHHDPESFPDAGGFNAGSPLYVVIRWLQFSAMLVLTGAVAFQFFVLGFLRRKQRPDSAMLLPASANAASVGFYAAVALVFVALVRLAAQTYAMHAPGSGSPPAAMLAMIGQTTWGFGWILQILSAVGAVVGFAGARRNSSPGWTLAAVSAMLGAFSPAFSGHAASAPSLRTLAIIADGIHIIGASGWLGSLFVLLIAGIPAAMHLDREARGAAVAELVNAFSPTALVFAGITATAGVFAAWLHLGNFSALWQTQYGQTLLVKLAILGVVTATGAYNFLYVKPRLGSEEGTRSIRRSGTIEVAVAVVVLLVTAVLVATPTAMDMAAMAVVN